MATKKKPSPKAKPKPKTPAPKPRVVAKPVPPLSSLAGDDVLEEPLVDASGVFRVTSQLANAQRGHDEDATRRFSDPSLVMAAVTDDFREEGPTLDDTVDDSLVDDEAVRLERRQRLAMLAARAQARPRSR
jgi:hypothetical protein